MNIEIEDLRHMLERIKLTGDCTETDSIVFHCAIDIALSLYESGVWDGLHNIYIESAEFIYGHVFVQYHRLNQYVYQPESGDIFVSLIAHEYRVKEASMRFNTNIIRARLHGIE